MEANNYAYFSSLLKTDYPKIYSAIVDVLDRHSIKHGLLKNTRDYWCRDYMPVQSRIHEFIQFVYHPPQFRNPTNSLRSLRSKPPRMRFLLFKLTFCHILTDMSA